MKNNPLILEVKGNSLDDGPGIRTVIFFKGCPLNCIWCHNPESKKREVEISYDAGQCAGCGSCIEKCPNDALSEKNRYYIDRHRCTLCFECIEVCPSGALSRIGIPMSIGEIHQKVMKDKPFFDTSVGGVTLSGGEPTIDMVYTSELMKKLKGEGVNIIVETCGLFNLETFMELVYPYVDEIYFDIKIIDPSDHKKFCGVSNDLILENFISLNKMYNKGGVKILPRTPLIPDITDTDKNIKAIAGFYLENGVGCAALLNYNPLWLEKNNKIGIDNPVISEEKMSKWIEKEKIDSCRNIFLSAGIDLQ